MKEVSKQPASGFTETNTELHKCAGAIVKHAKNFTGQPTAYIWAYREQGREFLSCDICFDNNKWIPITICAEGEYSFHYSNTICDEPDVSDMAEAIHLAGIITSALDAKIILGRHQNEVNHDVLQRPLESGETNGCINLWRT